MAMPAILSLLLVASTYFFVKDLFEDRLMAATASLFSAFSFQTVSNINGGMYANWLADSEALVLFLFLVLGLNRSDRRCVGASVLISILLLFTHPWTWLIIMVVPATYGVFTWVGSLISHDKKSQRFELSSVALVILSSLAVDGFKHLGGGTSGVQDVYQSSVTQLSIAYLPGLLNSLRLTVFGYLNGALDNPVIVAFAILGVLTMADLSRRVSRLLLSWVAVASAGILFSSFSLEFFQARIILLVPLQVLAAMGFLSALKFVVHIIGEGTGANPRLTKAFVIATYASLIALLMSYALQNVGFLYGVA
jgi:hypothetical protein